MCNKFIIIITILLLLMNYGYKYLFIHFIVFHILNILNKVHLQNGYAYK